MKFKLPENLEALSIEELNTLRTEAEAEAAELAAISDEEMTAEQLDDFEALASALDTIDARIETVEQEAEQRTQRLAAARAKLAAKDAAEDDDADGDDEEEEDGESDEDDEDDSTDADAAADKEKETVVAAGDKKPVRKVRRTPAPKDEVPEVEGATIVAATNVPGYDTGAVLGDTLAMAEAFAARSRGFKSMPKSRNGEQIFERFGVANIRKPDTEWTFEGGTLDEQLDFVMRAANEKRLEGGSLVAAGGWCAPSETLYDFCSLETVSGILSIPEITVRRGGINFTKGPDYGALAATWGFLQTEAQAEAGDVKVCYEIECPDFTEVRLDAIGFCITNGILTNVGYPELTRRILEIGAVAHAHKVNASVLSRISTLIGAATNFTEIGPSATADILDALTLQAEILRYQYALAPNATIEVVLPVWSRNIIKSDLSRRTGVENFLSLSDAQVQALFGARGLAVQWVYDWQPLPVSGGTAGQAWPTTVDAMLYPAGAYVKGTADVISLDTVYDSVGLSTNTYTAAFFEEGLFVANTCGSGRKVQINVAELFGRTGAADLGPVVTP